MSLTDRTLFPYFSQEGEWYVISWSNCSVGDELSFEEEKRFFADVNLEEAKDFYKEAKECSRRNFSNLEQYVKEYYIAGSLKDEGVFWFYENYRYVHNPNFDVEDFLALLLIQKEKYDKTQAQYRKNLEWEQAKVNKKIGHQNSPFLLLKLFCLISGLLIGASAIRLLVKTPAETVPKKVNKVSSVATEEKPLTTDFIVKKYVIVPVKSDKKVNTKREKTSIQKKPAAKTKNTNVKKNALKNNAEEAESKEIEAETKETEVSPLAENNTSIKRAFVWKPDEIAQKFPEIWTCFTYERVRRNDFDIRGKITIKWNLYSGLSDSLEYHSTVENSFTSKNGFYSNRVIEGCIMKTFYEEGKRFKNLPADLELVGTFHFSTL